MKSDVKTYLVTFAALQGLLALTVAGSYWSLGRSLLTWSLIIAFAKAAFIIAVFMRLGKTDKVTNLYPVLACAGLTIIFLLTIDDYLTR